VRAVDLEYWSTADLRKIGAAGFTELNLDLDQTSLEKLVMEAAGSPQLMQLLCLNTCFVLGHRAKAHGATNVTITSDQLKAILEQVSASTDFRSLVDVLDAGPKTRGTERKLYEFSDGSKGDVYRCVLKAVAADPPRLSFSYDELTRRTARVTEGNRLLGRALWGRVSTSVV